MDERSFREWYWSCHDELLGTLDEIYLLMIEEGVTLAEAEAIASATRKHVHRMIDRWRAHHRELLAEILELHEAAERRGGWLIPNTTLGGVPWRRRASRQGEANAQGEASAARP
jgi:hypothetical protein